MSGYFYTLLAACTAAALLTTTPADAKSVSTLDPQAKTGLDKALTDMVGNAPTQVPGLGVIVYKNGERVYSNFLGSRNINNSNPKLNKPVTEKTRFRVASVSKQFTAYTILQLAEQKKLDLDTDVIHYLGFRLRNPNYPTVPITVRMLMDHTSSLRDGNDYSLRPDKSLQEFFSPAGSKYDNGAHYAPLGQAPGHYFTYCNLNYGLLATIIEKVTGERFDLYLKNHIFKQLDMKAEYLPANLRSGDFANLGALYRKRDANGNWDASGPWHAVVDQYNYQPPRDNVKLGSTWYNLKNYKPGLNATAFGPQGSLRVSYNELEHDLVMLMNKGRYNGKRILNPVSYNAMISPSWTYNPAQKNGDTYNGTILSYGLGLWQIDGNTTARVCEAHPVDLIGHTGEAYGMLSGIFFRPHRKDGFLYMMNGEGVEEDSDPRSQGKFSGNYIWEENLMNAVCKYAFFNGK